MVSNRFLKVFKYKYKIYISIFSKETNVKKSTCNYMLIKYKHWINHKCDLYFIQIF